MPRPGSEASEALSLAASNTRVQVGSRGGRCFRRKSAISGLKSVLPRPLWPLQRKAGKMTLSSASWHSPRLATPLLIFERDDDRCDDEFFGA